MSSRSQRIELPCPNCGDDTAGPYCPTCGQRRTERRISLRRMLAEVVEDQLSVNAALPRTLAALLLRPGHLSSEYMAGRIQRYIPPFRLYLVSSVIFFLLLSLTARRDHFFQIDPERTAAAPGSGERADPPLAPAESDSLLWGEDMRIDISWTFLDSIIEQRMDSFRRMPPEQAADAIGAELMRRAPTGMFLLLPIFAALLKLLYIRRERFYVEHFVFGLHTHAFVFLLFSLLLFAQAAVVVVPALAWMVVYMYLAMRRFYQQGWFRTLLKFGILFYAYMIVFAVGSVGLVLVAVMLA